MLISIEETLYKSHFLSYKYFRGFVRKILLEAVFKIRILVQGRGGAEFKTAGIHWYFEDIKRGTNKDIGPKDNFETAYRIDQGEPMGKNTEKLIYDMAFRVRLYIASKISEQKVGDLTDRETLILELVGMQGNMSISEIGNLYPTVSNSTISTTITKLWKDKKLVDKRILPENQRVTTVSLTDKGRQVLEEVKRTQSEVFSTVTVSLGLTPDQVGHFQDLLENAIGFFDETLGLNLDGR